MSSPETALLRDRHIKYWLRCSKTFLPEAYTASDSNRMTLAFFIVAALDLLDLLDSRIEPAEREGWIHWIYSCQLDTGGFRGFTGTKIRHDIRTSENKYWDPANVPATFFALVTLIILRDDLSQVRREECLSWLSKVQRGNGSFGETLGEDDSIEGGSDLRFCCCAAGIRRILLGSHHVDRAGTDIDSDMMVEYIEACQAYDGGFSEGLGHESHSGLTYCAIGSLAFLDRNPNRDSVSDFPAISFDDCTRWLVHRQTTHLEEKFTDAAEQHLPPTGKEPTASGAPPSPPSPINSSHATSRPAVTASSSSTGILSTETPGAQAPLLQGSEELLQWAGFNGRPNKIADTCYCFWNMGALAMLGRLDLVDMTGMRKYLLDKTQHIIGGFGKGVGEPPDIMHAYLGLAALAITGHDDLPALDPMFCFSVKARQNLQRVAWWR